MEDTAKPKFKLNKRDFVPLIGLLTYRHNLNRYLDVDVETDSGWKEYQARWGTTRVIEAFYLTYQVATSVGAALLIGKGLEHLF